MEQVVRGWRTTGAVTAAADEVERVVEFSCRRNLEGSQIGDPGAFLLVHEDFMSVRATVTCTRTGTVAAGLVTTLAAAKAPGSQEEASHDIAALNSKYGSSRAHTCSPATAIDSSMHKNSLHIAETSHSRNAASVSKWLHAWLVWKDKQACASPWQRC